MSYAGAYDSGMMGSEAGTPFQPRHVVVLAELGDEEKAKYIEFLLENDVKVVEDRKGNSSSSSSSFIEVNHRHTDPL
jgi:hypothetical protein